MAERWELPEDLKIGVDEGDASLLPGAIQMLFETWWAVLYLNSTVQILRLVLSGVTQLDLQPIRPQVNRIMQQTREIWAMRLAAASEVKREWTLKEMGDLMSQVHEECYEAIMEAEGLPLNMLGGDPGMVVRLRASDSS